MKVTYQLSKRAISNVVGYVILISITMSLSILVYGWLQFYVSGSSNGQDIPSCPEGVNLIIKNYECAKGDGLGSGWLRVTLKNKGRFTINGYLLSVHDKEDRDFGVYLLDEKNQTLAPGEEVTVTYPFSEDYGLDYVLSDVKLVEIQPYQLDGGIISCKSISLQRTTCT
jgi:hypothetical protein